MPTTVLTRESVANELGLGQSSIPRVGRLLRWLLMGGAIMAAIGLGFAWWTYRDREQTPQYVMESVTRGDLRVAVTATGNLAPTNQVQVGSELSGIVKSVHADYDQRVTVGQVLARIDTTKLEAQISQTEAALAAARARVQQAQATDEESGRQLSRSEQLAAQQLISQSELDTARATHKRAQADYASAVASVTQMQATLAANRTDLAKMTIRSPINGVVLARAVEPGQTVAASFQAPVLFTLAEDLTKMELDVDVDEADVGQVSAGQEAVFSVDAYPDRTFTAHVAAVRLSSQKTEGVVTYKTVLYVDNTDLLLRPGMTATAELIVRRATGVVLVPNAALRFAPPAPTPQTSSGGGSLVSRLMPRPPRSAATPRETTPGDAHRQRVWVQRDGQLVAVPVTVGATDGRMTEIVDGDIEAGTVVVVDAATPGA
jgi:HlyD family secretion protein